MPVIRSCGVVLLACLLIGAFADAENSSGSPRLHLFLPPNVPADKVEIQYVLYGAFGAYGNFVRANLGSASVEIQLSLKERLAEQIKAFTWVPGCRVATFDIKVEGLDIDRSYVCEHSPGIFLGGRVKKSELPAHRQPTEIQIYYLADWACDFFGFADCMAPQFSIGTSQLDRAGHFELQLPDFASDPACLGSNLPSGFQLTLREAKTKKPIARLSPDTEKLRLPGGGLKAASVYPDPTIFIETKAK